MTKKGFATLLENTISTWLPLGNKPKENRPQHDSNQGSLGLKFKLKTNKPQCPPSYCPIHQPNCFTYINFMSLVYCCISQAFLCSFYALCFLSFVSGKTSYSHRCCKKLGQKRKD